MLQVCGFVFEPLVYANAAFVMRIYRLGRRYCTEVSEHLPKVGFSESFFVLQTFSLRGNAVKDFYVGWALRDQQFGVTGVPPQHFRSL